MHSLFQSLESGLYRDCKPLTIRSDTAAAGGFLGNNQTEPATMQVISTQYFLVYLNLIASLSPTLSGAS